MGVQYDTGEETERRVLTDKKLIDSKIYTNAFAIDENGVTDIKKPLQGLELLFDLEQRDKNPVFKAFDGIPMLTNEELNAFKEAANRKNYSNS
jgi:hypothetical protein